MFMGDLQAADYYGPIQPTQTWDEYQSWMTAQNVMAAGSVGALAYFVNPIVAAGAAAAWLMSTSRDRNRTKPKIQGG